MTCTSGAAAAAAPPTGRASDAAPVEGARLARVLMVTAWSPATETGGVSAVIRLLHRGLSARGHHVSVLVNNWSSRRPSRAEAAGMTVWSLRLRTPGLAVRRTLRWLRDLPGTLRTLRRLLAAEGIDVVHLHYAAPYQYVFRLLRWFGGPPYVVTLHGSDILARDRLGPVDRALVRFTLGGAARIVAVSETLARQAEAVFPGCGPVVGCPNGIDLAAMDAAAARAPSGDAAFGPAAVPEPFFLCVANVAPIKGVDVSVRAWALVRAQAPDLHLVVAGEPRESWEHCHELIAAHRLADRVHMLGALPHDRVVDLMRRATALVCPSREEGFGLVLVEMGALGRPVVCSSIPSFREIAGEGGEAAALMVPRDDPAALAAAVVRLIADPEAAASLGRALQLRVRDRFGLEAMASRYAALYTAALEGPPDGAKRRDPTAAGT